MAKIDAFRQITKIVLHAPKMLTSAKRIIDKDSDSNGNNDIMVNNINNINNSIGNSNNNYNSNSNSKINNPIDSNISVNFGKGSNVICGNVSYSQGDNIHNYTVNDTLSLARCSIITNTLVTTIQNYIRFFQSYHLVHVFAYMQKKLQKCT